MTIRKITQPRKPCTVEGCESPRFGHGLCNKHYRLKRHHGSTEYLRDFVGDNTPQGYFDNRHEKDANDIGCWRWTGAFNSNGYGQACWNYKRTGAHRFSFALHKHEPIGVLLHACDNSWCVNPDHLTEGTHSDNMKDKFLKNRHAKGETVGTSKLRTEQVIDIRRRLSNKERHTDIAAMYGISLTMIQQIRTGKSWKHIIEGAKYYGENVEN